MCFSIVHVWCFTYPFGPFGEKSDMARWGISERNGACEWENHLFSIPIFEYSKAFLFCKRESEKQWKWGIQAWINYWNLKNRGTVVVSFGESVPLACHCSQKEVSIGVYDALTLNRWCVVLPRFDRRTDTPVSRSVSMCFFSRSIILLVLAREWMGMGEWGNGMIIHSYCGSFPHSLLSTSK